MNSEQRRSYVRNRCVEKFNALLILAKEQKRVPVKPSNKGDSFATRYKLIASGKAVLKPLKELRDYTDLVDAYTYPDDDGYTKLLYKTTTVKTQLINEINDKKNELMDKVVCSDLKDALPLIKEVDVFYTKTKARIEQLLPIVDPKIDF
jgi:hypothetical protein